MFAALLAVLTLSNISKPLSGGRAGFVFFGTKTTGTANAWQKALASCVHSRVLFKEIPELLSWRLPSYATLLVEEGE
jgi:hypothetical protein